MNIKKIHFISGITISIFVGMHLFNHCMSVLGPDVYIEVMNNLREIYRNIIVETVLLVAVVVQIFSGLKLFFSKRHNIENNYHKLQIWSGLYLAFFLIIHVGAILTGRYILDLDTNFYFGAAGLNTFPFYLFFIPYYSLAILAFFGHIASIHYQKMDREILRLTVENQSKIIIGLGLLITVLILYGMTNGLTGIEIPEEYNIMVGK